MFREKGETKHSQDTQKRAHVDHSHQKQYEKKKTGTHTPKK